MMCKFDDCPVRCTDGAGRRTMTGVGSDLAGDRYGILKKRQRNGLCRCVQVRGR